MTWREVVIFWIYFEDRNNWIGFPEGTDIILEGMSKKQDFWPKLPKEEEDEELGFGRVRFEMSLRHPRRDDR